MKASKDVFFPHRKIPLIHIKYSSSSPAALELESNIHNKYLKFPHPFVKAALMEKEKSITEKKQEGQNSNCH